MLTLTSPGDSWLHRVPAAAKLAALAVATTGLFTLGGLVWPLLAVLLTGALYLSCGLLRYGAARLLPLWPFLLVLALWHGWTGTLAEGGTVALRLIAAVAAANLVTMTTRLTDMISVAERLASPLRHLGLPSRTLALSIALVIRFIPVLSDRVGTLRLAWSARSARRAGWAILVPATLAALEDADRVAEALRARGGAG